MNKVTENIKREREKQSLTVVMLAEKAGISFQALYNIEKGAFSPRVDTIIKLAEALKVSPVQFWL